MFKAESVLYLTWYYILQWKVSSTQLLIVWWLSRNHIALAIILQYHNHCLGYPVVFCICIFVFNLHLGWLMFAVLMFCWLCPAGLTMHASILAYMFNLVEEGKITTGLNPGNPPNNQLFIQEYVANLLKTAFPHLQEWVETKNTVCLVVKSTF